MPSNETQNRFQHTQDFFLRSLHKDIFLIFFFFGSEKSLIKTTHLFSEVGAGVSVTVTKRGFVSESFQFDSVCSNFLFIRKKCLVKNEAPFTTLD